MSTAAYIWEDKVWQPSPTNNEIIRTTQDAMIAEETIRKVNISRTTYEKGGNAGSHGVKFQVSLLVVSLLNAFRGLKDWKLSTENKRAGKFDDVVLEWPSGSILLQAKHKENKTKKITFEDLLSVNSKSDEFSLPKYFLSYHQEIKNSFKIKNVVICTNVCLSDKVLKFAKSQKVDSESILYYEGNDCSFYTFKEEILPHLKENVKSYFEKNLKNTGGCNSTFTDDDLQNFLENLQFYSDYPGKNDFEEVSKNILSKMNFHRQISSQDVYGIVMDWFQQKRGVYLTETHVKGMFLEIWRNKHWQTLDHYNVQFKCNDFNFEQLKSILYVVSNNPYLLLELKIYTTLKSNKANVLYITSNDGVDVLNQAIEAFELPQYQFLVIIWPNLTEDLIKWDKLEKVLVQHKNKRVIVVSDNSKLCQQLALEESSYDIVTGSVTLEDLSEDTRKRLLKIKNVVFQGTEISLEELYRPKMIVRYDESIDSEPLETLIRNEKIRVGEFPLDLDKHVSEFYVNRLFKPRNESELLETINEDTIFHVNSKVILISNVAGMGKSTVLSNLAVTIKRKYPHLWVIRIHLSDYTVILNDLLQNNETVISITQLLNSKQTTELTNSLEKSVFSIREKVVLMLDGLDEISPHYTGLVLSLLYECSEAPNFAKIFVTTRPHMIELLETKLIVKSFALQPFTEDDQIRFLMNYWAHNLKGFEEKCEQYARALVRKMMVWIKAHHHFAAIPLQARMLAEIFQQNDQLLTSDWEGCKEFLSSNSAEPRLPERMNITNLYKMFFEKKRKLFLNKENPSGNVAANQALSRQFDECISYARSLALEMILGKCKCQHFSSYRKECENLEENSLKIGIVQITNTEFHFVHRTFAEYLVGESVLMELQLPNQNEGFQRILFGEILFDNKYAIVRTFLDNLLQERNISLSRNNYQFVRDNRGLKNVYYKYYLIHLLAKEGLVGILTLICKCAKFRIIMEETVSRLDRTKYKRPLIVPGGVNTTDEEGWTPLHWAAKHNHLETVKFLINQGAIVNSCHKRHGTPLSQAVLKSNFRIVKLLVEGGANIKATGIAGVPIIYLAVTSKYEAIITYLLETVLKNINPNMNDAMTAYSAAYLGRLDILEELLARGLNVNDDIVNGETLIFAASRGGQLDTIRYLVQKGANINNLDRWGKTALHVVSAEPSAITTGELLIELGIDMDAVDKRSRTALHLASGCGNVSMVQLLVKCGANKNIRDEWDDIPLILAAIRGYMDVVKSLGVDVSTTPGRGRTLLHIFATSGMAEEVKFLIQQGMDVRARDNTGCTALYAAALSGNFHVVELLMDNGADINTCDKRGRTIMHQFASVLRWDMVERLLKYGADINAPDNQGRTIIHEAVLGGYLLEFLFEIGLNNQALDVNVQDKDGRTALHLCALKNQKKALEFLLEHGADTNVKDNDGYTALHLSALENHLDMVEVLLQNNVEVNSKDSTGCTALHLCVLRSQLSTVKFLVNNGADVNIKNDDGKTALDLCASTNEREVAKFLTNRETDVNIKDEDGCTSLYLSAWQKQKNILKSLKKHGSNYRIKNYDGREDKCSIL